MAKMLERSGLGKGTQWPQKGNVQRFFKGQAHRHNFAEQARHFLAGQGPRVLIHNTAQYLSFPLRAVIHHVLPRIGGHFYMGHLLGAAGTGTDQLHDLLINTVYFVAQFRQSSLLIAHG